jgi:uncharacterized surface protein with fasciclin (FAS1) repeats
MLRRSLLRYVGVAIPTIVIAFGAWKTSVAQDDKKPGHAHDAHGKNIVETCMENKDCSTLCDLLEHAGLDKTLAEPGPYTVFAPTNAAFEKLGKAELENLKKPENKEKLTSILKYHVVSGKALAADVKKSPTHKTLNGQEIKVTEKDGNVMINEATVTKADITCSNGVVHIIDTVLMPKEKK